MPAAEDKATIQKAFEALARGDHAGVTNAFAPQHQQSAQHFVQLARTALPDLHITLEDTIAEGDKVVARWTARGTHKGAAQLPGLGHVAATGKEMQVSGITIFQMRNGKIVETWGATEKLEALRHLGVARLQVG
jgi:predicted ester cyclase